MSSTLSASPTSPGIPLDCVGNSANLTSGSRCRIFRITALMIGVLCVLAALTTYFLNLKVPYPIAFGIAGALLIGSALLSCLKCRAITKLDEPIEEISKSPTMEKERLIEIERFLKEINALDESLQTVDSYVASQPELLELCMGLKKKEEKEGGFIAYSKKPDTSRLDPGNDIDRLELLSHQRNELRYELEERLRFYQRHPEIWPYFENAGAAVKNMFGKRLLQQ